MKKIISFALAIMMIATMSVTAFAATIDSENPNASIPVKGTYQKGGAGGEKVSVDVSWGSMEFTYTGASQDEWNPNSHSYDTETAAKWTATGNTITIKNHSNVAVNAKFSFAASNNLSLTYEFKNGDTKVTDAGVEIESADNEAYRSSDPNVAPSAPTAEVTFNITDGSIDKNYNTEGNGLGTITVTIVKKASTSN